jgi:hypothetical protein
MLQHKAPQVFYDDSNNVETMNIFVGNVFLAENYATGDIEAFMLVTTEHNDVPYAKYQLISLDDGNCWDEGCRKDVIFVATHGVEIDNVASDFLEYYNIEATFANIEEYVSL